MKVNVTGTASITGEVRGYAFEGVWTLDIVDGEQHNGVDEFWVEGLDPDKNEELWMDLMNEVHCALINKQ